MLKYAFLPFTPYRTSNQHNPSFKTCLHVIYTQDHTDRNYFFSISNVSAGDTQHRSLSFSSTHTRLLKKHQQHDRILRKTPHQWFAHITWQCPFNINTQRSKISFINLFKYVEHVKCIRINMDFINVIFIYFPASYKLDVEA